MSKRRSSRGLRRAARNGFVVLAVVSHGAIACAAAGLTSTTSLAALRDAADEGHEPEEALVADLHDAARRGWRWGSVAGEFVTSGPRTSKTCHPANDPASTKYLKEGAPDAYAQILGAHLAGDAQLAVRARSHVVDLLDTTSFRGLDGNFGADNQCILEVAISIPIWIETAKLLEGTSAWSASDRASFQAWLAGEVYPRVAWASRVRSNNWGSAGSLAAWAIAVYVDGTIPVLREAEPVRVDLAPTAAAAAHLGVQRARMSGVYEGDAACARVGIQPDGGIPEELRRGATGCNGSYLVDDDASLGYQTMHVELLVLHAELARRRGDSSLYDVTVAPGVPAILQAIRFVIANGAPGGKSWPWPESRLGTLIVAATYYQADPQLAEAAGSDGTFRAGRTLPYARVTHGVETVQSGEEEPLGKPGRPILVY
jgi:hypothetical protein